MSGKWFKKTVAIAVVLMFVVAMLAACGQQAAAPAATTAAAAETTAAAASTTAAAAATTAAPAKAGGLIAYSNKSMGFYFFVVQLEGVKRAAEAAGFTFEATDANFDSATQSSQFINFIAKKPAAIISDPIDSEGLIDAVNKAKDAGIPVAITDTPTTGGNVDVTVAFDNKIAGQMAAEEIVKALQKKYGEPKGVVVNAYGAMSSWAWRLRKEGFDEVMAKYPKITYVAVPGEGDMKKTQDALINAYVKYPVIDAVHCPSDTPGRGLGEALKQKNLWVKQGDPKHVIFVTIDGEPVANQNLQDGYYDATVVQDAISYGQIAVEMLQKYSMQGQKVPLGNYSNDKYFWKSCEIKDSPSGPYVAVPPYVMDPATANDPKHWGNIATKEWGLDYK